MSDRTIATSTRHPQQRLARHHRTPATIGDVRVHVRRRQGVTLVFKTASRERLATVSRIRGARRAINPTSNHALPLAGAADTGLTEEERSP